MSVTWRAEPEPAPVRPDARGRLRAARRALAIGVVLVISVALFGLARFAEGAALRRRRRLSVRVLQGFCRAALWLMGIGFVSRGAAMAGPGAIVANHASWLDILTLNAAHPVAFVSKAEVAAWPGVGALARLTGTLFINRDRRDVAAQRDLMAARLRAGDRLLFFPEGTSTDGRRVLPFKPALFDAFLSPDLRGFLSVQPVTVVYHAPAGADPRVYGWWGDMAFGPHVRAVLSRRRQGRVEVTFHPALRVADFTDRKALAARCEDIVRSALTASSGP